MKTTAKKQPVSGPTHAHPYRSHDAAAIKRRHAAGQGRALLHACKPAITEARSTHAPASPQPLSAASGLASVSGSSTSKPSSSSAAAELEAAARKLEAAAKDLSSPARDVSDVLCLE